jgi:DNA-binding HxlR family transcriptional regulator
MYDLNKYIHLKRGPKPQKNELILSLLPLDGSKKRWNDLRKEVKGKVSTAWLKRMLDRYIQMGLVIREVDRTSIEYPPPVYYYINKQWGWLIQNRKETLEEMNKFLEHKIEDKTLLKDAIFYSYYKIEEGIHRLLKNLVLEDKEKMLQLKELYLNYFLIPNINFLCKLIQNNPELSKNIIEELLIQLGYWDKAQEYYLKKILKFKT